jgi:hypothetical protein
MLVNAIEGVVENGRIRLREETTLPENATVYVIIAEPQARQLPRIQSPHLAHPEQAKDFRKQIVEVARRPQSDSA